jgi:hypothetical protein
MFFGKKIGKVGEEATRKRDAARIYGHASSFGLGLDDRKKRLSGERWSFVGDRVNNFCFNRS